MKSIVFYTASLCKGGAERVIINLAEQFYSFGFNVTLVTCERADIEYSISSNIQRLVIKEIGKQKKYSKIRWIIKCVRELRRICKKTKADYLVSFLSINHAIAATRFLKTKCIISIRNDPGNTYKNMLSRVFAKLYLPLAEGCVFQTSDAKKWFPTRLQKKSTVIVNPIKESFFGAKYTPIKNLVVTCGRLEKQKNQVLLIKAIELLISDIPDIKLYIFGQGSERKFLDDYIEKNKLQDTVFLKGVVEDVKEEISKASVFAMSSDYEGMPNALMEAMCIGIPCVCTDCPCGGPRELLSNECGLLANVGDACDLSNKIRYLLTNSANASLIGQNAKNKALAYTQENIVKAWIAFLEGVR